MLKRLLVKPIMSFLIDYISAVLPLSAATHCFYEENYQLSLKKCKHVATYM